MTRYKATLAYDGTAYQGFQRQAEGIPTIQAALEHAIYRVTGQSVTVNGAGRTDTGVHASGQVIAFDVEWSHERSTLLRALNATLPEDIALYELDLAPTPTFHPRFDALSRSYAYTVLQSPQRNPLLRHRTWYVWQTLDQAQMQIAAERLLGEHDFATFGLPPQGTSTIRTVYRSAWTRQGDLLIYEVEANAFLQHMVRRIVGMLVQVGRGVLTVQQFEDNLRSRDLSRARLTAPPQGLVLEKVRYSVE